jgi:hypothetical protein
MNSIPKNDNWEQELDATRVKLYELTKDMTSAEQADFFNSRGIETLKRHGVKAKVADVPIVRRPAQS